MDIKHIEYILRVMDTGSITKAAEQLYITPQALGKAVRQTEAELGAPLFTREKRRLTPTLAGEVLAHEGRLLVADYHTMLSKTATAIRQQLGCIRLACGHGVLHALGENAFAGFYQKYPDITLDILELPDLIAEEYVRGGQCELGFLIGKPEPEAEWACEFVVRYPLCAVVAPTHPLAKKHAVSVTEISQYPIITKNANFRVYHSIEACAQQQGMQLHYLLTSPNEVKWQELVQNGAGVGIGVSFINTSKDSTGTVSIPFKETGLQWEVYLCSRYSGPITPLLNAFRQEVVQQFTAN